MRKSIALSLFLCLLILPLLPALSAGAAETDTVTLGCASDVAYFILEPAPRGELHIAPATLQTANGSEEVWFVAVQGIDWLMRGVNNFFSFLMVSFNAGNRYLDCVKNAILQNVPKGAKLVLAGHSLGGMIVQQIICTDEITSNYEIVNTLTLGSPYVVADKSLREGRLIRLEDRNDKVPKFSIALIMSPADYNGATKMDSNYQGNPGGAHNVSYKRADIWGGFDALGEKGGSAKLLLNAGAMITLRA